MKHDAEKNGIKTNGVEKNAVEGVRTEVITLTLPTPFRVGPVHAYVLVGEKKVLYDTGPLTDEAWEALSAGLKAHGLTIRALDALVLSHHHMDHVGLAGRILREKDMPVYMHAKGLPYVQHAPDFMEARKTFLSDLYRASGVPEPLIQAAQEIQAYYQHFTEPIKDVIVVGEGSIPELPDWEVLHVPGHAPDQIALYDRTNGRMIGADHLIQHISSNAFVEPDYGTIQRPKSLLVYREYLKRWLKLPITIVWSGHGEVVTEPYALIETRLKQQEERAKHMLALLEGAPSAFEISKKVFPKLYEKEMPLVISEVVGHLDWLVEEGHAVLEENRGRLYYRPHHTLSAKHKGWEGP